jgi:hypothetical protein
VRFKSHYRDDALFSQSAAIGLGTVDFITHQPGQVFEGGWVLLAIIEQDCTRLDR